MRPARRGIRITLGLLWILDGLLQFQPALLTRRFAVQVAAPAGAGQPTLVSGPLEATAQLLGRQPVLASVGVGLVQLALGAAVLHPKWARPALAASVAWALCVWYLGEGLGGLLGGQADLLTGAPGAALLYAVLALAAVPGSGRDGRGVPPPRWVREAWAAVWLGGAVLQLLPGRDTNAAISMSLTASAADAPGWLAGGGARLAGLVPGTGVSVVVDLVLLQSLAALGGLLGRRAGRLAVIVGMTLSVIYWVAGQGMGQFWTGTCTDPGSAPLVLLLGAAVAGAAPAAPAPGRPGRPLPDEIGLLARERAD